MQIEIILIDNAIFMLHISLFFLWVLKKLSNLTCFIVTLTLITTLYNPGPNWSILSSTSTATAWATTSFIYYVMCLEARFYDYLASSDVKIK
jgi:hypothetical protein